MEPGKASRSAMGSGLLRAAHVREDPPPRVLADTLLAAAQAAELEAESGISRRPAGNLPDMPEPAGPPDGPGRPARQDSGNQLSREDG